MRAAADKHYEKPEAKQFIPYTNGLAPIYRRPPRARGKTITWSEEHHGCGNWYNGFSREFLLILAWEMYPSNVSGFRRKDFVDCMTGVLGQQPELPPGRVYKYQPKDYTSFVRKLRLEWNIYVPEDPTIAAQCQIEFDQGYAQQFGTQNWAWGIEYEVDGAQAQAGVVNSPWGRRQNTGRQQNWYKGNSKETNTRAFIDGRADISAPNILKLNKKSIYVQPIPRVEKDAVEYLQNAIKQYQLAHPREVGEINRHIQTHKAVPEIAGHLGQIGGGDMKNYTMSPLTKYLHSEVTDISLPFFQEAEVSIGYQIWDNAYTQVLRFLSGVAKDRKNDIRTVLSKYIVKNSINQIIFLFSPN